jgi:pimeloyl-ACP methyl ester carboxylesterase
VIASSTTTLIREEDRRATESRRPNLGYRVPVLAKDVSLAAEGSARGARIRFVEAGSGPPLVLLHDGLASHETFLASIEHLAASFRVVVPDLPGFGASEKPDPERYAYGYDGFADSVFDLVAALGLGRVHVCGHAMGGGVALSLAARNPSVVHKLVLTSALVYPVDEHVLDRAGRIPVVGALLWRQVMGQALFRAYIEGSVYAGSKGVPAGRVESFYASFNAPAARQAAHATIVAKADTRPLVARLPRVAAETLVLWGRDDKVAPIEHGRRLARELRGRFEVLECGRCPPDEEPAAFAAVVASFLQIQAASEPPRSSRASRPSKKVGRAPSFHEP